jgi:response regulator of citrate/malate metabolism
MVPMRAGRRRRGRRGPGWLRLAGVAATEGEAIDLARLVRPDLVLLDFGLSAPLAGFDVWRVLHELDQVPDVIAVTAAGDMGTVEKASRHLTYLCGQRIADRVVEHGRPGHPAYLYTLAAAWS